MRKKPIDSLERFKRRYDIDNGQFILNVQVTCTIDNFNNKVLKKLLQKGYSIWAVTELWYDSEEGGLDFNNWVEEYSDGVWDMTQKEVDGVARHVARKFSHLTRRRTQKAIPRSYRGDASNGGISYYLYMRDRIGCDYMIYLKKRGDD